MSKKVPVEINQIKLLLKIKRVKRLFYAPNVNMQYSFDSLIEIAKKQYGASLELGDIFVCDSSNQLARKAIGRINNGWAIAYIRLDRKSKITFQPMNEKNGIIK